MNVNLCPHCGMYHQTTCPRIKAIEYHDNGVTVKRIEFHAPLPLTPQIGPNISNTFGSMGPSLPQ